ncbi:hypothetical protein L5515_010901 [Caenorhabditis briggsae]|uniref:Transmembrane protein n=1 Tax=Caenorhabditis briggsae TaxID=6238 RepID=A0AAE9ERJ2_CAEBR|nr:hypothetical protein L3Y34_003752 [Caenorhabditis briggsae]UMM27742.1 hypothetical protein L5515_010901 [Caenorhabditis briggsae]
MRKEKRKQIWDGCHWSGFGPTLKMMMMVIIIITMMTRFEVVVLLTDKALSYVLQKTRFHVKSHHIYRINHVNPRGKEESRWDTGNGGIV